MARLPKKGYVGFFNDPDVFVEAARAANDRGFRNLDGYTPFPIHGIEEVMRIRRSWIPAVVLVALVTGAFLGWTLQYWTHVVDWPINVGGKPLNAWPAYVVIIFECAILVAGLTNFLLMFAACRLFPNPFPKVLDPDITNDRFALIIPTPKASDEQPANELLKMMGADEIRKID